MMTLALLVGIWTTGCIQTQIAGHNQGFVVESYAFTEKGDYEFSRAWYKDAGCTEDMGKDVTAGTVKLGKKMSGMFISGDTYEADFSDAAGTDLGAVAVGKDFIQVARGTKNTNFRNTMVGFFKYQRQ